MCEHIRVDLWDRSNRAVHFVVRSGRSVAVYASVYMCLSLSSVLFSLARYDTLVVIYTGIAGIILLFTIFVPVAPVTRMRLEAKQRALEEIDSRLSSNYRVVMERANSSGESEKFAAFQGLLQIRERVAEIPAFPYKIKSLTASVSVLVLSSVPILLQALLTKAI